MPRYSHVFELGFSVCSDRADASDVTPDMLWAAIRNRFDGVTEDAIEEMCIFCPDETVDDEEPAAMMRSANEENG
jgi:hypothetical protein